MSEPTGQDPHRWAAPNGAADRQDRDDLTEYVDLGPVRRPWPAYVLIVLVLVGAGALGAHRLLTAHPRTAAQSTFSSTSSPTSSPSTPNRPGVPDASPGGPSKRTGLDEFRLAVGPVVPENRLGGYAYADGRACRSTGSILAIRPAGTHAGTHPLYLTAMCARTVSATSVVLRRDGGSLGSGGAVVTYPMPSAFRRAPGPVSTHHGMRGYWTARSVRWVVHGQLVEVIGDVSQADLARIARATSVLPGVPPRPRVREVAGYRVISTGPFMGRGSSFAVYGVTALGYRDRLGRASLTLAIYPGSFAQWSALGDPTLRDRREVRVQGRPGVLAATPYGGAWLTWQLAPQIFAVVQCVPRQRTAGTAAALLRIAAHSQLYALSTHREPAPHPTLADAG